MDGQVKTYIRNGKPVRAYVRRGSGARGQLRPPFQVHPKAPEGPQSILTKPAAGGPPPGAQFKRINGVGTWFNKDGSVYGHSAEEDSPITKVSPAKKKKSNG